MISRVYSSRPATHFQMTMPKLLVLVLISQAFVTSAWTNQPPPNNHNLLSLQLRRRKKNTTTSVASTPVGRKNSGDEWDESSLIETQRASLEQAFNQRDLFSALSLDGTEYSAELLRDAIGHDHEGSGCDSPDCEVNFPFIVTKRSVSGVDVGSG